MGAPTEAAARALQCQALEKFRTRLTTTIEAGEGENACVLRTKVTVDAPVFGLQSAFKRCVRTHTHRSHTPCVRPQR